MTTTTALPRSAPSAQEVSAAGLSACLDAWADRGLQLHSVMMLRHGHVIAEGWWRPYAPDLPHMLYSLSKSFTSTAVGLAVSEGRLSVDDAVVSFFPDDLPAAIPPNLAAMRVRHLLTMATGHDQDTTGRLRDGGADGWVRAFLRLGVEHAPGSKFVYNSGASYMLSAIVQKVTGSTLLDYLTPRLFAPLGIEGAAWESSPEGIHAGGWGLSLRTEDIARFGQLYLSRGRWLGRQVVPSAWVDEATSFQMSNAGAKNPDWAQGYGYQFWRCRHDLYRGDGAFGQFCVVMPAQDCVLAVTSGAGDLQGILDCVMDHVLPAIDGAGSAEADAHLRARLGALSLGPAERPTATPDTLAPAAGRRYAFAPNDAGLEALALDIAPGSCRATIVQGGVTRRIECGFGEWRSGSVPAIVGAGSATCAGHAGWEADGALRLDWYFPTTPFGRTLKLRAVPDGLAVHYRANVGQHANGLDLHGA